METIYNLHNFVDPLPAHIVNEWREHCSYTTVSDQTCIYQQGSNANEVFQIVSGEVKLCNYSKDGKEFVVSNLKTGDCFGELGLIDGLPRLMNTYAVGQTVLRVLSKQHFFQLYNQYPEIAKQLNLMHVRRIRLLWQYNEDATNLNLHQRVARTILRLSHSHGQQTNDKGYSINTSHEDIGKMLCCSRQSVSKELKLLEGKGLIRVEYGKITINDPAGLSDTYEMLMDHAQITPVYQPIC